MPEALPTVSVLLVDDRRENLVALEAVLAPLGQKLVRAGSGTEALAAVRDEQFAVILMDIRMPGLDGFETAALLKQHDRARDVPVIFLSAYEEQHHVLRSYSAGAVDYLQKPFDPDALRSKVSVFVRLRQNELALERAHEELEQRVAARTAELAEANHALACEIVERKAAEQRLFDRAFHDPLTGLANRALFMAHLTRAVARARRRPDAGFAVLMIDVDRFKIVNDSLGHLAGDGLLCGLGTRLLESLREVDTVARFGGDEFAVLLDGVVDVEDATRLAGRVEQALQLPFQVDGKEVFTTLSVGIAMMSPRYERAEDLLRDADAAMYRAKEAGRSRCQVFDVEMHRTVIAQLHMESELRRALERGELRVHYQPIMSLQEGGVAGFEALVRWQHPQRGLLGPLEFIPLAEENGLIRKIGRWVLAAACEQLAAWHHRGLGGLTMSVNFSAREFAQPELASEIEETVRRSGIAPTDLQLEITESVLMSAGGGADRTLARLHELGVAISLDDFGTGYSSLGYLHRFPVGCLKIDRSFVGAIDGADDHAEIARAIIALAHNLRMQVTAEGVETAEQAARLRALGCDRAQGFYFARPLDATAAQAFVEGTRRSVA